MPPLKKPAANLRSRYHRYLKISLILSLSFLIIVFKFSPTAERVNVLTSAYQDLIQVEDIINTAQRPDKPTPPKAPQIIEATLDDIQDIELQNVEIDENENVGPPDLPFDKPVIEDDDHIFIAVEQMPQIIGGIAAIQKKVHYTEIAKRSGIEGKVIIEAIVNKEGNVIDAKVIKGLPGGLNEISLNAVKDTKFEPGKQRGKPVKVKMYIPIKFVLK